LALKQMSQSPTNGFQLSPIASCSSRSGSNHSASQLMSVEFTTLKVAIVHYWFLDAPRGGEKVVYSLCELFPQADIFTHVIDQKGFPDLVSKHKVTTSFIQRLPYARKATAYYLPLMPLALEQFDLSGYDLVISSESGPA